MSALAQDLRHGVRLLTARPGFAGLVIAALGLGIGANVVLFTVVNGLLFRPLPYERPHELFEISQPRRVVPLQELRAASSFSGVTAFIPYGFSVSSADTTTNLYGLRVSANVFGTLGARPLLGRTSAPQEDQPAATRTVVLSYEYWRERYGDPGCIGKQLRINGQDHTIIGVMPHSFVLWFRDVNIFVPDRVTDGRIVARLKHGINIAQAEGEVKGIFAGLPAEPGRPDPAQVIPMAQAFRPNDVSSLLLLQAAAGLVLLITCANLGNLMLVRASSRRRELEIRTALGAKPTRLVRQLVAECAVLAALGSTLGLLIASWSVTVISTRLPANIGRVLRGPEALSIDYRVLAFTAAAAMFAVLVCGLAPALSALRLDVVTHLKESTKGASPQRQRFGQLLVMSEIGLAVMLLIGAVLMMKSILHLATQSLGFSADRVMRATVELLPQRYPTPDRQVAVYRDIVERVRALPGVESVAVFAPQVFPFGGPRVRGAIFEIQGQSSGEPRAEVYTASPEYFRLVRIPLLQGRMFTEADTTGTEPVALLSDVVAKRHFAPESPMGRRIRVELSDSQSPWITVIGVVGDVRNPVGSDVQPTLYRPWAQTSRAGAILMVRTRGEPMSLGPAVRREIKAVDPSAPEARVAHLGRGVANYISPQRFIASILSIFACIGLLLAAVGVYGVMRYWVHARIPEIGIRVALGAQRYDVVRLVLRRAAITAAVGAMLGVVGALALHRVVAAQLYGVSSMDFTVFLAVSVAMGAVALLAAFIPARFAARVDPIVTLREH